MLLNCYAIIPDAGERLTLVSYLRHHHTPYTEKYDRVDVEISCMSYRTVEKIIGLFESVETTERGMTLIGTEEEVNNHDP